MIYSNNDTISYVWGYNDNAYSYSKVDINIKYMILTN